MFTTGNQLVVGRLVSGFSPASAGLPSHDLPTNTLLQITDRPPPPSRIPMLYEEVAGATVDRHYSAIPSGHP